MSGMDKNPFGGRPRLDRLDLGKFASPFDPPEKRLWLDTIRDAVMQYCYFGLGKNGTTSQNFSDSVVYLFRRRSFDPKTWGPREITAHFEDDTGKRITRRQVLTDEQIKATCFDLHFEWSGMSRVMGMDRFLSMLKQERLTIYRENQEQILKYVDSLRTREISKLNEGVQLPLTLLSADVEQTLVFPQSPRQIAELLFVSRYLVKPAEMIGHIDKKRRKKKRKKSLEYVPLLAEV